jgi:hypothetical protein
VIESTAWAVESISKWLVSHGQGHMGTLLRNYRISSFM